MAKSQKEVGALVQDAYHYALAAAGGEYGGHESAFAGLNADHTRGEYLRMARAKAREAFESHAGQWARECRGLGRTLASAGELCAKIRLFASVFDIDANGGEMLCSACRRTGAEGGWASKDGLCYECSRKAEKLLAFHGLAAPVASPADNATRAVIERLAERAGDEIQAITAAVQAHAETVGLLRTAESKLEAMASEPPAVRQTRFGMLEETVLRCATTWQQKYPCPEDCRELSLLWRAVERLGEAKRAAVENFEV